MCSITTDIPLLYVFFFFNDTATTEIYTLSLHDALPISLALAVAVHLLIHDVGVQDGKPGQLRDPVPGRLSSQYGEVVDRKSTRLNSSHANISYAVFCLKKKKKHINIT